MRIESFLIRLQALIDSGMHVLPLHLIVLSALSIVVSSICALNATC